MLCSTRFALPALREFAFFNILAAVAIPRYCDEMIENIDGILTGTGIPVIELDKETFADRLREAIEENDVNLGLVMTFPYKIPSAVYELPSKGFYNIHSGPLPQYRGADPVFQQIINREKHAGVTIHKLDGGIDTGPLVMSEMLKIDPSDTYGLLTTKLAKLAAKLTGTLTKLLSLELAIATRPQDESKAVYYQKQVASDVSINWQVMEAAAIIALINACNPWNKGAITKFNNKMIRLLEASYIDWLQTPEQIPGTIITIDDRGLVVAALNNQAVCVQLIHIDEGFLLANRLKQFGVVPGARFSIV